MCVVPAWVETLIEPSWATIETGSPPAWVVEMYFGGAKVSAGGSGVGSEGQVVGSATLDAVGRAASAPSAATVVRILLSRTVASVSAPVSSAGNARQARNLRGFSSGGQSAAPAHRPRPTPAPAAPARERT